MAYTVEIDRDLPTPGVRQCAGSGCGSGVDLGWKGGMAMRLLTGGVGGGGGGGGRGCTSSRMVFLLLLAAGEEGVAGEESLPTPQFMHKHTHTRTHARTHARTQARTHTRVHTFWKYRHWIGYASVSHASPLALEDKGQRS